MIDVDDLEAPLIELKGEDILDEISRDLKTPNNIIKTDSSCNVTENKIFIENGSLDTTETFNDFNKNAVDDQTSVECSDMESLRQIEEISLSDDILDEIASGKEIKTHNDINKTESSCNVTGNDIFVVNDSLDATKTLNDFNENDADELHTPVIECNDTESWKQKEICLTDDILDEIDSGKGIKTHNDIPKRESSCNVTENEISVINDSVDALVTCNDANKNTAHDLHTPVIECSDAESLRPKEICLSDGKAVTNLDATVEEINSNDSFSTAEVNPIIDKLDSILENTELCEKETESNQKSSNSNEEEKLQRSNDSEFTPSNSSEQKLEESQNEIDSTPKKSRRKNISPKSKRATPVRNALENETPTLANGHSVSDINSISDVQENENKDDKVKKHDSYNKKNNVNSLDEDDTNLKQASSNITDETVNVIEELSEKELHLNKKGSEDSKVQSNYIDSEDCESSKIQTKMNSKSKTFKTTKKKVTESPDEIKSAKSIKDSSNIKESLPNVAKKLSSRRKTIVVEDQNDQSGNNEETQLENQNSIKNELKNEDGISPTKNSSDKDDSPIKIKKKRGRPKSINKVNESEKNIKNNDVNIHERSDTEKLNLNRLKKEDEKIRKSPRIKRLPFKVKHSIQKVAASKEEKEKNKGTKKKQKSVSNLSKDVSDTETGNVSMVDNHNETEENDNSDEDVKLLMKYNEGNQTQVVKRGRGRPRKETPQHELPKGINHKKEERTNGEKINDHQKENISDKNVVVPRKRGRPSKSKSTPQRTSKSEDKSNSTNNKRRKLLSPGGSESEHEKELSNKNDSNRNSSMKRENISKKRLRRKDDSDNEKENKKKSNTSYENSSQEDENSGDEKETTREEDDSPRRKKSRTSLNDKRRDINSFQKQQKGVILNNSYHQNNSKDVTEKSNVTVRKRGRPRKYPQVEIKKEILIKRGRGRPRKKRSRLDKRHFEINEENVVRKKRGRPRKSTMDNIFPKVEKDIDTDKINDTPKRKGRPSKNKQKSETKEELTITKNNSYSKTSSNSSFSQVKVEIITDKESNVPRKRQRITRQENDKVEESDSDVDVEETIKEVVLSPISV